VTGFPGPARGACFAGPHSLRPPPLAPPAPTRIAPLRSSAPQRLMAGSDFSCPFIAGYGSSPSRRDPATLARPGWARDLPVPAQGASAQARVSDHAGLPERSRWRTRSCCLPLWVQRRRPGLFSFRGSMAGLRPPLPTLRRRPRGHRRTARGRCGSLLLHRIGLSPTTPRRSPGARDSLLTELQKWRRTR
jgi:hypothetical protein